MIRQSNNTGVCEKFKVGNAMEEIIYACSTDGKAIWVECMKTGAKDSREL
jgi:hypothetical protein